MKRWKRPGKGLSVLLLAAVLMGSVAQPVLAEEESTKVETPEEPESSADGETPADTKNPADGETLADLQKPADSEIPADTKIVALDADSKDDNGAKLNLLEQRADNPSVTTSSITWDGGLLKIPVDMGGYTADDLVVILRLEPENTDQYEYWRYPALDGNFAVYSPIANFESCDQEQFWTKQGTYDATLEFHSSDAFYANQSSLICEEAFSITVPASSEMWKVEEKEVKFDGSQDLTFSFKNGTNYYELKSISYIELFLWKGGYINPSLGNGYTYDMAAGTLTIDKNLVKSALLESVQGAMQEGLEKAPTNAYLNVDAVTASGEEVRFNLIDKMNDEYGIVQHVPAWSLDLTDFNWTAEDLKIVPEATDYVYTKGEREGATIKCTGELQDFVSVFVDDVLVDRANYTLESGSTILTFTSKYLNTLSVGKHAVTLNYTYGSVDTELTVRARTNPGSGSTGGSGSGSTGQPKPSEPAEPSVPQEAAEPANPAGTAVPAGTVNNANASGSVTSVQTGDSTSVLVWVFAATSALAVCGILGWRRYLNR